VQGVLVSADDRSATIRLDTPEADGIEERTVAFDQIDRARTVFLWGPAPKPGAKPVAAKKAPSARGAKEAPATSRQRREENRRADKAVIERAEKAATKKEEAR